MKGGVGHDRGVSSLIALITLVAVTVIGVTLLVGIGSSEVSDSQRAATIDGAEHAMTQLDSRTSLVALGSSSRQRIAIPLGQNGVLSVDEGAGRMNISIVNASATDVVLDETLGAVVYENGRTTIAYQGGGVWKRTDEGSTMISPPEFHYREQGGASPTVTLPLVVIDRAGPVSDTISVEAAQVTDNYPVAGTPDRTNPLTDGEVRVRVESSFYRAWGTFFEERTGGTVSYDHPNETVEIRLVIPSNNPPLAGAVTSAASGYGLSLENDAAIDSYNSSAGGYTATDHGSIAVAGNVELRNQAAVRGTIRTAGTVSLSNPKTDVTGDVICSDGNYCVGDDKGTIHGDVYTNGSDISIDPVDRTIKDKIQTIKADNDNGAVSGIESNLLNDSQSDYSFGHGDYYLSAIDIVDKEIVFDTSSGNISVAVAGDISMVGDSGNTEIDVQGDGAVRFYVGGDDIVLDNHVDIQTDANQTASMFWLYGLPGTTIALKNHANVTGVIYAPNDAASVGSISLRTHSELYGGAVGHVSTMDSDSMIHYDESLARAEPVPLGNTEPITYLHISTNRVNVSSP